jgi:hypothetical protein
MDYAPVIYITQRERFPVPRTRGGLTPYLKTGGCAAVLLRTSCATQGHAVLQCNTDEAMTTLYRPCHRPPLPGDGREGKDGGNVFPQLELIGVAHHAG